MAQEKHLALILPKEKELISLFYSKNEAVISDKHWRNDK
jgi:hypothetical protein